MAETKNTKTKQTKKTTQTKKATQTKKRPVKKQTAPKKPPLAAKDEPKDPKIQETTAEKEISSEEKIRKVGDRLSEAADKGVETLREVFGKVRDFSVDAAELTRLKVEIHRLKSDRDRMLTVMGEKLWELKNSDKIKELRTIFEEDFKKLEELKKEIDKKEKTASKISL